MDGTNPPDWVEAKLAEGQAFNGISEARSQADWVQAWRTWTLTVQRLRDLAKHPEPVRLSPSSEFEFQSEQSV